MKKLVLSCIASLAMIIASFGQAPEGIKYQAVVRDASNKQLLILSGGNAGDPNESAYTDMAFFVSGSIGSKGLATKGTAVFGGDTVVSGSLFAKQKQIYHIAGEVDATTENYLGIMGNPTDANTGFSKFKHQFIAPYSGRLKSISARCAAGDGSNNLNVKFYTSNGADATSGGTSISSAMSIPSSNTTVSLPVNDFEISSGNVCALSIQRASTNPGMTNITFIIEYDIFD